MTRGHTNLAPTTDGVPPFYPFCSFPCSASDRLYLSSRIPLYRQSEDMYVVTPSVIILYPHFGWQFRSVRMSMDHVRSFYQSTAVKCHTVPFQNPPPQPIHHLIAPGATFNNVGGDMNNFVNSTITIIQSPFSGE
jgi:hypothetical protein